MSSIVYRTSAVCNSCDKVADFTRPTWIRGGYPSRMETTPDGWMGEIRLTLPPNMAVLYAHICDVCRKLPFETVMTNINERVF